METESRAGVGWTPAVPLKLNALSAVGPQQISGTNAFPGWGGGQQAPSGGVHHSTTVAEVTGPWAAEHIPCMIHIPDKTGTGDTAADPTVREKELVGQSATAVPAHLKPPGISPRPGG